MAAPGTLVVSAIRWAGIDRWTQAWWPQGIAVGTHDAVPLVLVSWFSRREDGGARITVLRLDTLRYSHVWLVEGPNRAPVAIHAGGIAWTGDRLLVAATRGGLREFRLSDIPRAGRRFVLPQIAHLEPAEEFRYSFLANGTDGIVAGEYSRRDTGRLARLTLSEGGVSATDVHTPGIPEMQGAVIVDGRWIVSSSRGDKRGGDLWVGDQGAMVRHEGALPPGPEDLSWWPGRRQLWGVTEYPAQRWVFAVDLPG